VDIGVSPAAGEVPRLRERLAGVKKEDPDPDVSEPYCRIGA